MLNARVVAVDLIQPYLDQLVRSANAGGLSHLIEARRMDIGALEIPPSSMDLIWSEGAAYILGFEESLRRWRALLKPDGMMAVSECTWLVDRPPEAARSFWSVAYPPMATIDENRRRAQRLGYEVLDTFVLPVSAWWNDYYTPLLERVDRLRPTADTNLALLLDETEREIELFRRHGDSYGYVFYLLQRRDGTNQRAESTIRREEPGA
jgi:serine/threonine-protein kinase HipA